jgi:hypothetical protein
VVSQSRTVFGATFSRAATSSTVNTPFMRISAPSDGENCLVNFFFAEAQVLNGAIDIPMAECPLRLHQVMIELLIYPIGEGFAHAVGPELPCQPIGVVGLLEDTVGLHAREGAVDTPTALKDISRWQESALGFQVLQPMSKRCFRIWVQYDGSSFHLLLHVPALNSNLFDQPPMPVDIANTEA